MVWRASPLSGVECDWPEDLINVCCGLPRSTRLASSRATSVFRRTDPRSIPAASSVLWRAEYLEAGQGDFGAAHHDADETRRLAERDDHFRVTDLEAAEGTFLLGLRPGMETAFSGLERPMRTVYPPSAPVGTDRNG